MNAAFVVASPLVASSQPTFGQIALGVFGALAAVFAAGGLLWLLDKATDRLAARRAERAAARHRHPAGRGFVQAYVAGSEDPTGLPDPDVYDQDTDPETADFDLFERLSAEMSEDAHAAAETIAAWHRYDTNHRDARWFR